MRLLPIFLLLTSAAGAADLTGIWIGQIPIRRNGEMTEISFQLKQQGSTITGKMYGDLKSWKVAEGSVTGDRVDFVVMAGEQQGNQINETRLRFTGCWNGDTLELTRERVSSMDAINGAAVFFRDNPKVPFRVKRLF